MLRHSLLCLFHLFVLMVASPARAEVYIHNQSPAVWQLVPLQEGVRVRLASGRDPSSLGQGREVVLTWAEPLLTLPPGTVLVIGPVDEPTDPWLVDFRLLDAAGLNPDEVRLQYSLNPEALNVSTETTRACGLPARSGELPGLQPDPFTFAILKPSHVGAAAAAGARDGSGEGGLLGTPPRPGRPPAWSGTPHAELQDGVPHSPYYLTSRQVPPTPEAAAAGPAARGRKRRLDEPFAAFHRPPEAAAPASAPLGLRQAEGSELGTRIREGRKAPRRIPAPDLPPVLARALVETPVPMPSPAAASVASLADMNEGRPPGRFASDPQQPAQASAGAQGYARHPTLRRGFPCPEEACGESFADRHGLIAHGIRAHGKPPAPCPNCGTSFDHPWKLDAHRRSGPSEQWGEARGSGRPQAEAPAAASASSGAWREVRMLDGVRSGPVVLPPPVAAPWAVAMAGMPWPPMGWPMPAPSLADLVSVPEERLSVSTHLLFLRLQARLPGPGWGDYEALRVRVLALFHAGEGSHQEILDCAVQMRVILDLLDASNPKPVWL